MAEIIKIELDVKDFKMTSTVEETCFVNIPEDEIKMENIEVQGKLKTLNITFLTIAIEQMALDPQKNKNKLSESLVNNYNICIRHTCF